MNTRQEYSALTAEQIESVMQYITEKRTVSAGNLADYFHWPASTYSRVLRTLESEQRVRLVSPHCMGNCENCSGAESDSDCSPDLLAGHTIVISLESIQSGVTG